MSLIEKIVEEANRFYGLVYITAIVDVETGKIKAYAVGVGGAPIFENLEENEELIWIHKHQGERLTVEEVKEEIERQLEDIRNDEVRFYAPYPRYLYKKRR